MPRFNPDKITKLISALRTALNRLRSIEALDKESFLNDPDKVSSAKYNFIVAIESAIDICNHIISQNGYRAPEDYADAFQVMAEQG
ncbi:MAG TPA: HepT-like ribonuclease domain-containing protein, partial [Candidatus Binatia bacterium]|nr:HepT-like ribonuclease domain-containing protein [Candidatus Binatia bacterium]